MDSPVCLPILSPLQQRAKIDPLEGGGLADDREEEGDVARRGRRGGGRRRERVTGVRGDTALGLCGRPSVWDVMERETEETSVAVFETWRERKRPAGLSGASGREGDD